MRLRPVLIGALGGELAPETMEILESGARQVRQRANGIVYDQGSAADGLYLVCHGCVLLEWRAPRDFIAAFRLATAHECFGHRSFCAGEPRSTVARSVTSSLLLHLPAHVLEQAAEVNPGLYRRLARILARDSGPKLSKITRNGHTPVRARLAYVLIHLTERLERSEDADGLRFGFPLRQKDLSNMLDVSQETVSRILHDFQQEGLLAIEHNPRRLLLIDRKRVEAIAENAEI